MTQFITTRFVIEGCLKTHPRDFIDFNSISVGNDFGQGNILLQPAASSGKYSECEQHMESSHVTIQQNAAR